MLSYLLSLGLFLVSQEEDPAVSFVPADSYAIRRFAEVIEDFQTSEQMSLREKLIQRRAKLLLTEQHLDELDHPMDPAVEGTIGLSKESMKKALEALADHLTKEIRRLEAQVKVGAR